MEGANLSDPISEKVLEDVLRARRQLPEIYGQLQERQDKFWEALQTQYLETLKFTKDKMGNNFVTRAKVGDVCLIYTDQPRLKWKMAVILQLIESKDGQHRQAVIKTENGTTTPNKSLMNVESYVFFFFRIHLTLDTIIKVV